MANKISPMKLASVPFLIIGQIGKIRGEDVCACEKNGGVNKTFKI